jgi:hypothetical protein
MSSPGAEPDLQSHGVARRRANLQLVCQRPDCLTFAGKAGRRACVSENNPEWPLIAHELEHILEQLDGVISPSPATAL